MSEAMKKGALLSAVDVAELLEVPLRVVAARCRFSFFAGAREDQDAPGGWWIPRGSVERVLGLRVEPMFSIMAAAALLGVSYHKLFRVTARVRSVRDPLPPGMRVRGVLLFLGEGKPMVRIPEGEIVRLLNLEGGRSR